LLRLLSVFRLVENRRTVELRFHLMYNVYSLQFTLLPLGGFFRSCELTGRWKDIQTPPSERGSLTEIPVVKTTRVESGQFLFLSVLCMIFILVALLVSTTFFCLRQRSHLRLKEKLSSLGTDTSTDAPATYQLLIEYANEVEMTSDVMGLLDHRVGEDHTVWREASHPGAHISHLSEKPALYDLEEKPSHWEEKPSHWEEEKPSHWEEKPSHWERLTGGYTFKMAPCSNVCSVGCCALTLILLLPWCSPVCGDTIQSLLSSALSTA
ncbi:hypothetical protein KUCAC02_037861, partial [Chaenocephalus aceratus]